MQQNLPFDSSYFLSEEFINEIKKLKESLEIAKSEITKLKIDIEEEN